ncbi:MAG: hypothetical protein ABR533_04435 [Desulfonatronovibrio sp.]
MNISKLSKLQKWILVRASQEPDEYSAGYLKSFEDSSDVMIGCLFMARVINEYYGVKSDWEKRAEKFGNLLAFSDDSITTAEYTKKYPVRAGCWNFTGADTSKQRVSVSRAFKSLEGRGFGQIVYGQRQWTAFKLSDEAIETVNSTLHYN